MEEPPGCREARLRRQARAVASWHSRHSVLGAVGRQLLAPGHSLLLYLLLLRRLPWLRLHSHFYVWALPGHISTEECACVDDILGSKGAGRAFHGVAAVLRPAGLTEPLAGMETFRSEAL